MSVEPSVVEGAPPLLGDEVVARLHIEFVDKVGPVGRADDPGRTGPIGAPGCSTSHVDQHDGRAWRRNAWARLADRSTISPVGWTVVASTIPFCKSITMSAGLGSKVVSAIVLLLGVGVS